MTEAEIDWTARRIQAMTAHRPEVDWTPDRIHYAMLTLCAMGFHHWTPDRLPDTYICADCGSGLAPVAAAHLGGCPS